jgi:hypothetical protein
MDEPLATGAKHPHVLSPRFAAVFELQDVMALQRLPLGQVFHSSQTHFAEAATEPLDKIAVSRRPLELCRVAVWLGKKA